MAEIGWVKIHRNFIDWEWYQDINVRLLALHLILKANHVERRWRGVIIERGQLITSSEKLATEIGLKRQQIRTAIKKLEKCGFCNQQSTSKYTLLTICNYGGYQDEQELNQPTSNQQVTSNQPTSNQQVTTTKECKNIRNKEINKRSTIVDQKKEKVEFLEEEDFGGKKKENPPKKPKEQKEKSCAKKEKVNFRAKLIEIGITTQTLDDWLEVRKAKRLVNTQTALKGIIDQLRIAYEAGYSPEECIKAAAENSWGGFNAKWMENLKQNNNGTSTISKRTNAAGNATAEYRAHHERRIINDLAEAVGGGGTDGAVQPEPTSDFDYELGSSVCG